MEFPTHLLSTLLALMLVAANCARLELADCELTALLGTILKFGSLFRLCVEFLQRRLPKLIGADVWLACFSPDVTWSTDNCLRRIFLLSLTGLSFRSIDFCLRNKFFALLGWNCCRMVDIFVSLFTFSDTQKNFLRSAEHFYHFYGNPILYLLSNFMSAMQIFFGNEKQSRIHTRKSFIPKVQEGTVLGARTRKLRLRRLLDSSNALSLAMKHCFQHKLDLHHSDWRDLVFGVVKRELQSLSIRR